MTATPGTSLSPAQQAWQRLQHHRPALFSLGILALLYLSAIVAGFIAPYHYAHEHRKRPDFYIYHPPMRLHFFDANGQLVFPPYVHGERLKNLARREYEETSEIYPLKFLVRGDGYTLLGPYFPSNIHFLGVDQPARLFLLGTDKLGRDIFSRILYGARVSLFVGIAGVIILLFLGITIGAASGYFGAMVDFSLMRLCDLFLAIPQFYLVVALVGVLPSNINNHLKFFLIVMILSGAAWASLARVIRGMVLAIKQNEYIMASKILGASNLWIVRKHIIPNMMSYLIVFVTLSLPYYILGEITLSFLGLGINEPETSWGLMLQETLQISVLEKHQWVLAPGIFIFITVMAFNFLGDGLRDALDPRQHHSG